jgi:hypothetical protein
MGINLQEINIQLASSEKPLVRVAGMAVRAIRRMPVDFYPGADKEKFNLLLKQEDGEALRRRNLNKNK